MIIFKKSGIFYDNDINPEHEDYVYKKVDSIVPYLTDMLEFDKNLTLRDFFSLLKPDVTMLNIVFGSHLGHFPLEPYIEESERGCVPDGKKEMEYITCSWVSDQFDYRMFYEKHKNDKDPDGSVTSIFNTILHEPTEDDKNEIAMYTDVHGWGLYDPDEDDGFDDEHPAPSHISYAIEFTPLNRMAHIPIKLDTHVEIRDRNEMGDEDPIVEGEMGFSVFDAVGAILSEISFCGLPNERDERWQDIVDSVDEAKERFDEEDYDEEDEEDTE
jgi:hypothetical protein